MLTSQPHRPPPVDDAELEELPPIDGDLGDGPEPKGGLEDADAIDDVGDAREEGGASALDDATGEDDDLDASDLEGDETERGWLDEAADSPEVGSNESGDAMLLDAGEEHLSLEDEEDEPLEDEDFNVGEASDRSIFDSAEEGPLDGDEELREADLPALDADRVPGEELDDDAAADQGMLDERIAGDESLGLPWAAEPWVRVGPPLSLAWLGLHRGITALACGPRGAWLAGRGEAGDSQIVHIDLEGARREVPTEGLDGAGIAALDADGTTLSVVSEAGRLFVSRDGGERFQAVPVPDAVAVADALWAAGVLWVRTRTGGLLAACGGGERILERCAVPGTVLAICRDGQRLPGGGHAAGVLALVVDEAGDPSTWVRGGRDGRLQYEPVQAPAGRPRGALVARGEHAAYVVGPVAKGGVMVRRAGGPWKRFAWEGRVTALAWLGDSGTLLAATYSDADDATAIVRLDAAGLVSVVAKLGTLRDDSDADAIAIAMACDDPRGVVWVAGGFGVAAFAV